MMTINILLLLVLPGALGVVCHQKLFGAIKRGRTPYLWAGYSSLAFWVVQLVVWQGEPICGMGPFFAAVSLAALMAAGAPLCLRMIVILCGTREYELERMDPLHKKQDYTLSAVRLVATLLVFFCHAFEQLGSITQIRAIGILGNYCSVGVPMFLILSGYLYSCRPFEEHSQRVRVAVRGMGRVLLDYYIYAFVFILPLYWLLMRESVTPKALLYTLMGRFGMPKLVHFWYIPYALLCYLMTPFLYDLKRWLRGKCGGNQSRFVSSFFLLAVLVTCLAQVYGWFFQPVYLVCYLLGFFLPDLLRWGDGVLGLKRLLCCLTPIVLWATGRKIYLKNIVELKLEGNGAVFLNLFYDFAHLLLGLELFLLICLICLSIKQMFHDSQKRIVKQLLKVSDRYSYDIYITHMLYIKGVLSVMRLTSSPLVNTLMAALLTLASAVLLRGCCEAVRGLGERFDRAKQ